MRVLPKGATWNRDKRSPRQERQGIRNTSPSEHNNVVLYATKHIIFKHIQIDSFVFTGCRDALGPRGLHCLKTQTSWHLWGLLKLESGQLQVGSSEEGSL